jgi:hypothetical protein
MMSDLRPIFLREEHIDHVAATRTVNSIGQWDIITNDSQQTNAMKLIKKSLPKWLKNTSMDPDCPHNFPEPEITTSGNNNSREDSSQGDVSYLSSSAGSYDLLMENECDNVFNEAPSQRSRNSMSVSGFS